MKKIMIALFVLVGGFAGFVASRPAKFRIERSAAIHAPASVVYALVADFHKWNAWSPWDKRDPGMKRTFSGPESGTGAHYAWQGNKDVGEGAMTITDTKPAQEITIKLEFKTPMEATNTTVFAFKEHAGTTFVQWAMEGENNFVGKAFSVFMDMDKMVGGDFEQGLAAMKSSAEAEAKKLQQAAAAAPPPTEAAAPSAP